MKNFRMLPILLAAMFVLSGATAAVAALIVPPWVATDVPESVAGKETVVRPPVIDFLASETPKGNPPAPIVEPMIAPPPPSEPGPTGPSTELIYMGDTTIEQVQIGYSGTNDENLEYWFARNGITNEDGSAIDPIADQLQHELFYTSVAREYEVEFLGIGRAGYKSPFGVFTYTGDTSHDGFDPAGMVFHDPLFVQNVDAPNTTYNFSVDAGTHFGFYLNSNGKGTNLSTVRKSNPKANSNRVVNKGDYADGMDHALFFITNKGVTIAFEDIVGGGDADFEDLVVNLRATDGSDFVPTPEPGTFALMGLGLLGVGFAARRRRNR